MPSIQKVHIDKTLSNLSLGFKNEQFIADQIFLTVGVDKQSDRYNVYGKEHFRVTDDRRAPGTESSEINWTLSNDTFYCEDHAIKTIITDAELANADDEFNLKADATELVTDEILLNKEVSAAATLLDSTNYDSTLVYSMGGGGTNPAKWSDYENSNPVMDIAIAKERMHKKSGIRANTLVISETVKNTLKFHPKILGLFTGITPVAIATMDHIKMALGVDNIIVGSAMKSGATNPGQDDELSYIWGNSAVLAYIPGKPGKKIQSIGYTFMWNCDGMGAVQVRQWYEIGRRSTIIEAERWYSHVMISKVAGFLFTDAVTPLGA